MIRQNLVKKCDVLKEIWEYTSRQAVESEVVRAVWGKREGRKEWDNITWRWRESCVRLVSKVV